MTHLKLLKELEKVGLDRRYNISDFMETNFEKPIRDQNGNLGDRLTVAVNFLQDLSDLQFIKIDKLELSNIRYREGILIQWFGSDYPVHVQLRVKGLEHLHQHRFMVATNRNYTTQFVITFMSMVAALAASFVALMTYYYR